MLALPAINGGIRPKDLLVSISCAMSPWQNRCKDDRSQLFEAANDCRGAHHATRTNARIKRCFDVSA
jgi:hypothetical protein